MSIYGQLWKTLKKMAGVTIISFVYIYFRGGGPFGAGVHFHFLPVPFSV